jgi:hypothetical protein
VAVARVRKAAGFAQWLNAAETELGVPLMAALTAPLNHLDIAVSGESLLSILKPTGAVTETAACSNFVAQPCGTRFHFMLLETRCTFSGRLDGAAEFGACLASAIAG